jgi:hypothetical protein
MVDCNFEHLTEIAFTNFWNLTDDMVKTIAENYPNVSYFLVTIWI